MWTSPIVGNFVDKREARFGFRKDEHRGNFAFFNITDEGSDVIGVFRIAGKGKVDVGGSENIERNDSAGRKILVFCGFEFDGERVVLEDLFFSFGEFPV